MKNNLIYPYYISYLTNRLIENKITKSSFALLKMSNSKFDEFVDRFTRDELFKEKIIELHKSEIRDQKIDDIFDDIT